MMNYWPPPPYWFLAVGTASLMLAAYLTGGVAPAATVFGTISIFVAFILAVRRL
jgi:hypothetical protein